MNRTFWSLALHRAAVLAAFLAGACGGEDVPTDPTKLCASGAGLAARISGTPKPVDFCVSNDRTSTSYTSADNRYYLTATAAAESLVVTITISFPVLPDQPRNLNISSDSTLAFSDPRGAYFFYREVRPGTYDRSASSVSGTFRLTVTDTHVATGTFSNLSIELEDTFAGTPAGERAIAEGFFAVTPD